MPFIQSQWAVLHPPKEVSRILSYSTDGGKNKALITFICLIQCISSVLSLYMSNTHACAAHLRLQAARDVTHHRPGGEFAQVEERLSPCHYGQHDHKNSNQIHSEPGLDLQITRRKQLLSVDELTPDEHPFIYAKTNWHIEMSNNIASDGTIQFKHSICPFKIIHKCTLWKRTRHLFQPQFVCTSETCLWKTND